MCGFSGLVAANRSHPLAKEWSNRFADSARKISHRGQDDSRFVNFNSVSLHHFRLAFQDLESGRQPMLSRDGQYAITFNGEIYNHHELRSELNKKYGHLNWRTHSDTETILEGWIKEGANFFDKLEGEFVFVIVRTDGSEWHAARDHFGVKPLFFALADCNTRMFSQAQESYTFESGLISFASEIKALPAKKIWNRDGALRQFVGLFEPICTPFETIIQCPPGGRIVGRKSTDSAGEQKFTITMKTRAGAIRTAEKRPFWSSAETNQSLTDFRHVFEQSVNERLLSDVELGVYLSGGIDSKAVSFTLAKILQNKKSSWQKGALKSFTVGFESAGYDESQEAIQFANHLGFDPHVLKLSNEALNYSYPHAVYISENLQPFTNGAGKWWLSLFARQFVPGVLTGDGADELLCGYPSFRYCAWWAFSQRQRNSSDALGQRWRDAVYMKRFMSQSADPWLAGSSAEGNGEDFVKSLALWGIPHPLFGQIETISSEIMGADEARRWLASQADSVRSWFLHGFESQCLGNPGFATDPENALVLWQNYFCQTHLPVQILNWVGDRMEMANTLEGRTPFLSGGMRKFVGRLPDVALVQGFLDKAILRKAFASQFPRHFATTPKKQFNAPFLNFEHLCQQFSARDILEKMGISAAGNSITDNLIKGSRQAPSSESAARDRYLHTHRMSALQTIVCSAIVQRTIVEGITPTRNENFEQQILKQ